MFLSIPLLLFVAVVTGTVSGRHDEFKLLEDHKVRDDYTSPLPYTYINQEDLPANYEPSPKVMSRNQHLPHYCGSCWAHGALTSLADRIKMTNSSSADEINLSIQYVLNCGTRVAGSCHGGSHSGVYDFIKNTAGQVPYETCQPYLACSKESTEGFCKHVDTTCSKINTCKTCNTFSEMGGTCTEIDYYPNATIAEYGTYSVLTSRSEVVHKIQAEIYARGPVAAGVNAEPLLEYEGGIVTDKKFFHMMVNHVVSIVGWGTDEESGELYWIVRNSWGQYWGEMGYFNILAGHNSLGIEMEIAWATPGQFTVQNYPCYENGENCVKSVRYQDPSTNPQSVYRRLQSEK